MVTKETQKAMDVDAETVSLKNNECSIKGNDDVAQAMNGGGETVPFKDGEGSAPKKRGRKKKKRGRKSKAALAKTLEDGENEKKADDVAAAGRDSHSGQNVYVRKKRGRKSKVELKAEPDAEPSSAAVVVRKSTRSRNSSVEKENNNITVVEEKKKETRGRKRKIVSTSEKGENGGVIKNKVGPGRKRKIAKKEPESDVLGAEDQDRCESEIPIVENKGYGLRKPKYIEQEEVPKINKHDPKVT